jgi:prevent-host-death family protein
MTTKWQMQDAKSRFAELVRKAGSEGPQVVTYRGVDTAVVLSIEEYKKLQSKQRSFVDHLFSGPKFDDEIVDMINERSRDTGRDFEF